MREILFKAKRKDNGEWEAGYYEKKTEWHRLSDHWEYVKTEKHYICVNMVSSEDSYIDRIEVVPETICQYTGLTDKNGNKIWENDILRGHGNSNDLAKVVFGKFHVIEVESLENIDSVVGWHTEVIPTDALSKCEPFCLPMPLTDFYIDFSEFEVIGNIFDKPELLKAGEA